MVEVAIIDCRQTEDVRSKKRTRRGIRIVKSEEGGVRS